MVTDDILSEIRLNYKCICLFAHPGHELAILNTLSQLQPIIHIITNGGGRNNHSRLSYSENVMTSITASQGAIWGRFTDLEAYSLLKDKLTNQIVDLTKQFISYLSQYQNICIISDAFEGYNPIHDLAAVISEHTAYYLREMGRKVIHLSFSPILATETGLAPSNYNRNIKFLKIPIDHLRLDKKIRIANDYLPLQAEIQSLANCRDFNCESLFWHQNNCPLIYPQTDWHPFWEKYSQDKVAQGHYPKALTYRDDFHPIYRHLLNIKAESKSA